MTIVEGMKHLVPLEDEDSSELLERSFLRRGIKFATTPPCGPVFLLLPTDTLRGVSKSKIIDQAKFNVPMHIRPSRRTTRCSCGTSSRRPR